MLPVLHRAKKKIKLKLFNCNILLHKGYCKSEIDELIIMFRVVVNIQHP